MNKRIEELAVQAGFKYIKEDGIGWAGNYNSSLDKFAELIIRECAEVARETRWAAPPSQEQIARCICQYFGVEL